MQNAKCSMQHAAGRRRGHLWLGLVVMVLTLGASVTPAFPQQPPQGSPQEEFVPVKDLPQDEQLPAAPLLISAYAFVWVALLVYVWTIWRRLLKVEREMHDLASRIGQPNR